MTMETKKTATFTLSSREREFAAKNYYIVINYLRKRQLPFDEWFDVVIFRYLRSVHRWHTELELHYYTFQTIAEKAMQSAIGGEYAKRSRRIQAISLEEVIPGTDGMTYGDIATYDNLDYIPYERSSYEIQL